MSRLSLATRIKGALDGWRAPLLGWGSMYGSDKGFIPPSWDWNFWQEGKDPLYLSACSAVEACVSAYAQTVAMLPGTVWRKDDDGGRTELPQSALARVLQQPNQYQTRSDFLLNQVRALYFTGNCYAIAEKRNDVIVALHPVHPQHVAPYINRETNDVFWSIAPSDLTPGVTEWPVDGQRLVPDEYVWHVALATPFSPLVGVTPLTSACLSMAANCNMNRQMLAFLANAARPSGTLNTDLKLTRDATEELRQKWKEHSTGMGIGGSPILTHGLKWNPLNLDAPDAQLIEFYKLTVSDIARALRVPLPLIGVMDGATFNNSEVLMQFWKASGLGFLLEHLELSLDKFFGLPTGTYCELDADALLRSEFKSRIDALVRGVQGGIFSPNEARATEGLPAVDGGEQPRVQQQLVALDWEPPAPAAPTPPQTPQDAPDDAPDDAAPDDAAEVARALAPLLSRLAALETRVAVLTDRSDRAPGEQAHAIAVTRSIVEEAQRRVAAATKRQSRDREALDAMRESIENALEANRELSERINERLAELRDGADGVDGSILDRWRGLWDVTQVYKLGDIVNVPDGSVWICDAAIANDFPVADSEHWRMFLPAPVKGEGFRWRGVYVAGIDVERNDIVTGAEGAAWIWQGDATRSMQCPGEAWQLFVKQGSNGRGRPGVGIVNIIPDSGDGYMGLTVYLSDGTAQRVQWEVRP